MAVSVNYNLPVNTDTYVNILEQLRTNIKDVMTGITVTGTNIPTGTIKFQNSRWETWSGTAWSALSTGYKINIQADDGTAAAPSISFSGDTNTGLYWISADKIGITTGGTSRLAIDNTSAVFSVAISTTGDVTAYASDARLKTDVVPIESPLAKLEAIRGVTYKWNEKGQELGLGTEEHVGVIAQEIEAVLPQLVVESAHKGYKTVKYDKLTALLIEAVKELNTEIKSLKSQFISKE